jgi:hypothetical protein
MVSEWDSGRMGSPHSDEFTALTKKLEHWTACHLLWQASTTSMQTLKQP